MRLSVSLMNDTLLETRVNRYPCFLVILLFLVEVHKERESRMKLLKMSEVSELTGIPEATLRFWRHVGVYGPPSAKLGRRVCYREADVVAWVDAQFEVGAAS